MIVKKFYEYLHPEERFTKISTIVVVYYDNDIVDMHGYFNSDDILDVARIIQRYNLRLSGVIR